MHFDELKPAWRDEIERPATQPAAIALAQKTDRRLRRVVIVETLVCAALFCFSMATLIVETPTNFLLLLAHAIIIVMALFIPYRLLQARNAKTPDDWTLRSNIERAIETLGKQKNLLNDVALWYVAPLLVAVFAGSWGGHAVHTGSYVPDLPLVAYWIFSLLLAVILIALNRYSARRNLQPALERLIELRRQLDE